MDFTLKKEAIKTAATFLQPQARFDQFGEAFNHERPYEAMDGKCPAEVYRPSPRPCIGLPEIAYPFQDHTAVVTNCGRTCLERKKVNFRAVFAGPAAGTKEVDPSIRLVPSRDDDPGHTDLEEKTLDL